MYSNFIHDQIISHSKHQQTDHPLFELVFKKINCEVIAVAMISEKKRKKKQKTFNNNNKNLPYNTADYYEFFEVLNMLYMGIIIATR